MNDDRLHNLDYSYGARLHVSETTVKRANDPNVWSSLVIVTDWWEHAKQLERNNQLDEAETVIGNAIPHLGFAAQIATLYAERLARLSAAGDRKGAAIAHEKAVNWMTYYASQATSGGEGTALSRERDIFLARLGPMP